MERNQWGFEWDQREEASKIYWKQVGYVYISAMLSARHAEQQFICDSKGMVR